MKKIFNFLNEKLVYYFGIEKFENYTFYGSEKGIVRISAFLTKPNHTLMELLEQMDRGLIVYGDNNDIADGILLDVLMYNPTYILLGIECNKERKELHGSPTFFLCDDLESGAAKLNNWSSQEKFFGYFKLTD